MFSNETGQVMFGSGGQIYKVPYEVQRAYSNALSANHYINITGLELENEYSYLCYTRSSLGITSAPALGLIQSATNRIEGSAYRSVQHLTSDFYGGFGGNNVQAPTSIRYRSYNNNISKVLRIDSGNVLSLFSVDRTGEANQYPGIRDRFIIGASGDGTSGGPVFTSPVKSPPEIFFGRLIIYNREVSIEELRRMYSNGNLESPPTLLGAIHDYRFHQDYFEIIDNKVVIRDRIGGKHGEVMNLPAGTLQEQLDYANDNLIVPFYD